MPRPTTLTFEDRAVPLAASATTLVLGLLVHGAPGLPLSRLVLGSGFDPLDFLAYAVGLAAAVAVMAVVAAVTGRGPGRPRRGA